MDIGSGAGLPGIVLSIIGYKNLHLVDKSPKKSIFLENCKSRLGLEYIVHNKSITDLKDLKVDYITARAFAPIEKIISLTKKIIYKHTKFILLKGKSYLSEIQLINQILQFLIPVIFTSHYCHLLENICFRQILFLNTPISFLKPKFFSMRDP